MSVLILKLQQEGLHEDFLQHTPHRGKFVLTSEWSEALAYNFSCQDNGSSGLKISAKILYYCLSQK